MIEQIVYIIKLTLSAIKSNYVFIEEGSLMVNLNGKKEFLYKEDDIKYIFGDKFTDNTVNEIYNKLMSDLNN